MGASNSTSTYNKRAFDCFKEAAEEGYVPAQYEIGIMYLWGWVVEENLKAALKWLQKAADQNYPEAHYRLGEICERSGEYQKAIEHYEMAANEEMPLAQRVLDLHYLSGDIVSQSDEEGHYWLERAAKNGDRIAQERLEYIFKNTATPQKESSTSYTTLSQLLSQTHRSLLHFGMERPKANLQEHVASSLAAFVSQPFLLLTSPLLFFADPASPQERNYQRDMCEVMEGLGRSIVSSMPKL